MFGKPKRSDDEAATTTNVNLGSAHFVVQAGTTGDIYLPGHADDHFELDIPELNSVESLLSFANTKIGYFGRVAEFAELNAFLNAQPAFSWWVWTGPAGIGKSRLAVEICRSAAKSGWHAGFLREVNQAGLGSVAPESPTLIIVDYAAQRSKWLSDALATLSRRSHSVKVRVLVLERDTSGEWWPTAQRVGRLEESYQLTASMYAEPRTLPGLNRPDARALVRDTATQLGQADPTAPQVEEIVDEAECMDRDRALRPLFAQVATVDRVEQTGGRTGRDDVLRRIIARSNAHLRSRITEPSLIAPAENLLFFATAFGGLTVEEYADLPLPAVLPKGLLPDVFRQGAAVPIAELVEGLRPDIVGELFVLDRLDHDPAVALASRYLLRYAATARPDAYRGFVERAIADHTNHPRLLDLLAAAASDESSNGDLELAVAVLQLLNRSDHLVIAWVFERIAAAVTAGRLDETSKLVATAWFKKAKLVRQEGDARRAYNLFDEGLIRCDPTWSEHSDILNNRGIALHDLKNNTGAVKDFSAVIDSPSTSAEVRACALNNRADMLFNRGDLNGSIADRTAVLALAGTSYNRRYVALSRRARTLRSRGDTEGAHRDIAKILETDDIAIEQKMRARLFRAEWAFEDGRIADAQAELAVIAASYRNFDVVLQRLNELRTVTQGHQPPCLPRPRRVHDHRDPGEAQQRADDVVAVRAVTVRHHGPGQ